MKKLGHADMNLIWFISFMYKIILITHMQYIIGTKMKH